MCNCSATTTFKAYSGTAKGKDGCLYSIRFFLTDTELQKLTEQGLLPEDTRELLGMQDAITRTTAAFEAQAHVACGGLLN